MPRAIAGSYVGDGTGPRTIVACSYQPLAVFAFGLDALSKEFGAFWFSGMAAGKSYPWDHNITTASTKRSNRITGATTTGFTVGTDLNGLGLTYSYLVFPDIAGVTAVGSYTGIGWGVTAAALLSTSTGPGLITAIGVWNSNDDDLDPVTGARQTVRKKSDDSIIAEVTSFFSGSNVFANVFQVVGPSLDWYLEGRNLPLVFLPDFLILIGDDNPGAGVDPVVVLPGNPGRVSNGTFRAETPGTFDIRAASETPPNVSIYDGETSLHVRNENASVNTGFDVKNAVYRYFMFKADVGMAVAKEDYTGSGSATRDLTGVPFAPTFWMGFGNATSLLYRFKHGSGVVTPTTTAMKFSDGSSADATDLTFTATGIHYANDGYNVAAALYRVFFLQEAEEEAAVVLRQITHPKLCLALDLPKAGDFVSTTVDPSADGKTWLLSNHGIDQIFGCGAVFISDLEAILFFRNAADDKVGYRISSDGGLTWGTPVVHASKTIADIIAIRRVLISFPSTYRYLLLLDGTAPSLIWTEDDGATWTDVSLPASTEGAAGNPTGLEVFDQGSAATVLVAGKSGGSDIETIWRSTNTGSSFATSVVLTGVVAVASKTSQVLATVGAFIWLFQSQSHAIYRSNDDGVSFTKVFPAIGTYTPGTATRQGTAIVSCDDVTHLIAVDRGQILLSLDQGINWDYGPDLSAEQASIAGFCDYGDGVVAGFSLEVQLALRTANVPNGVWRTTDFGETWHIFDIDGGLHDTVLPILTSCPVRDGRAIVTIFNSGDFNCEVWANMREFAEPEVTQISNNALELLPIVYGDFRVGGLRGPVPAVLIDQGNLDIVPLVGPFVFCAAAHTAISIDGVYIDDILQDPSTYTVNLGDNFQQLGEIATISFTTQPTGPVTWRGRGLPDSTATLMENVVDQLLDLLVIYGGFHRDIDFDQASFSEARAAVNRMGYKTAFVVRDTQTLQDWLTEMLFNVMGYWRVTGSGKIQIHIDEGGTVPESDLVASIIASRDCLDGDDGVTFVMDREHLVNGMNMYYLWSWGLEQSSSRIISARDLQSIEAYGEIRKAVTLKGLRRESDIRLWATVLYTRQSGRTRVEGGFLQFSLVGARFTTLTIGDYIAFSWPYGPTRELGHPYVNEILRVVEVGIDPTRGGLLQVTAVDVGTYVTRTGSRLLTPLAL